MHGYEVMYGDAVEMILYKKIGLSHTNLAYPPLVAWIMALSYLLFFIPLTWLLYISTHFQEFLKLVTDSLGSKIDFWQQTGIIFNKEILGIKYWQNAMYW